MTKKKRKKESWKEKQRRIALKHQKALEAQRIQRLKAPKKREGGFPKGKLLVLTMFLLLIVGVYAVWSTTQPATNTQQQNNQNSQNNQQYEKAPDFALTDIDGKPLSLKDFRGKVVVLDIFQKQCSACTSEITELKKVQAKYSSNDVEIISVSVNPQDTVQLLKDYRTDHEITWRIAQDTDNVGIKYAIQYTPTIVVIDDEGFVRFRQEGLVYAEKLYDVIEPLLSG
ncbi:hypothetical protein DRO34_03555 [Candidatus Bathyarchaeota archaeon]|nr:MAG: hypothetical protein DRO34_03555 [Candidatus Bathyarchaeota archaeon]